MIVCDTGLNLISILFNKIIRNYSIIVFLLLQHYHEKKVFIFISLFIYFWQRWVFVAVQGLSLVEASRSYSLVSCADFSLWWFLLLHSMGSRARGLSSCGSQILEHSSIVVAHGLSCPTACGIFLEQCLSPRLVHWQVDS